MAKMSNRSLKKSRDKALWCYKHGMIEEARQIYRSVAQNIADDIKEFAPKFRSSSTVDVRASRRLLKSKKPLGNNQHCDWYASPLGVPITYAKYR